VNKAILEEKLRKNVSKNSTFLKKNKKISGHSKSYNKFYSDSNKQ
jgi:hypothetical protein